MGNGNARKITQIIKKKIQNLKIGKLDRSAGLNFLLSAYFVQAERKV